VLLEKTLESTSDSKNIQPVNPKGNQPRIFTGRTDAEAEAPILWPPDVENWLIAKDPDAEKDRRQEGEGDDRGWDGWVASPTQWTWVWVNSGSWWWTGKPGVLQSMGSQRVWNDWVTELNVSQGEGWLTDECFKWWNNKNDVLVTRENCSQCNIKWKKEGIY